MASSDYSTALKFLSVAIANSEKWIKFQPEIRYITTTDSKNGLIPKGTPIWIRIDVERGKKCFTLFTIMRVGDTSYRHQQNDVEFFDKEEALQQYLEGVTLVKDIRFARERIDRLQKEIQDIEDDYDLQSSKS